jgi:hypothetical protein
MLQRDKKDGGLGFRDIHAFNLAMLAKQCWRLWSRPESLCAKILKAKYCANSLVLEAKPKRGMSYTWRSILRGLEVMKMGMIWRVGDGRNLKIWSDPWIPRELSIRPITPRGGNILTYVEYLIDPGTGSWDVELVRDVFWEEDAKLILALPVNEGRDNVLAWHYDDRGMFSVKSAYRVYRDSLLRRKNQGSAQGGSNGIVDPMWAKIWKSKCANKVKHFIWRLAHNSHPLRENLVRRGMKIDTICPVCNRFDEDGGHLFLKCKLAKNIWRELKLDREWEKYKEFGCAREVVHQMLLENEEKRCLMFTMVWYIWAERNLIREEGRRRPAEVIAHLISIYADEMKATKLPSSPHHPIVAPRTERWKRPPEGILKLNCDASFIPGEGCGGWGFFIRDSDGDVVLAGCGRVDHLMNAMQAETVACLQGVQVASNLGIGHLILETDAMKVKQAWASN